MTENIIEKLYIMFTVLYNLGKRKGWKEIQEVKERKEESGMGQPTPK